MKVSVISTVKNDESSIKEFLDSLLFQSRKPDEIVIVDGGSTDKTVSIIRKYIQKGAPIRLIIKKGANISEGRNIAIKNAKYDIIASLDVGVRPNRNWLKIVLDNFDDNIDVISPWTDYDPKTDFEKCVAEITGGSKEDFDEKKHIPPARNLAFRKDAWKKVGGFPEDVPVCEDTVFGLKLIKEKCRIKILYDAVAYWHLRNNLRVLFRQHFSYAKSYAKLGFINMKSLILRFSTIFAPTILKSGYKCYRRVGSIKSFITGILVDITLKFAWAFGGVLGYLEGDTIKLSDDLISLAGGHE